MLSVNVSITLCVARKGVLSVDVSITLCVAREMVESEGESVCCL